MPRGKTRVEEMLRRAQLAGVAAGKVDASRVLEKEDLLTPEGLILLECWARDGMTLEQIAKRLQIGKNTLLKWRYENPELQEAFKKGKELVDYEVENALLKAALGYTKKKTITYIGIRPNSAGSRNIGGEEVIEEVGPSVTACLAWLNNRKPDSWKHNRDNSISSEDKMSGVTIQIIKGDKTGEPAKPQPENDSWDDDGDDDGWGDE